MPIINDSMDHMALILDAMLMGLVIFIVFYGCSGIWVVVLPFFISDFVCKALLATTVEGPFVFFLRSCSLLRELVCKFCDSNNRPVPFTGSNLERVDHTKLPVTE